MKLYNDLFQDIFFKEEKYKLINIVDELIDRLPSKQDKWTIMGLINYLNVLYALLSHATESSNYKIGGYIILNLRLLDKQDNELFFAIKKKEKTYECIDSDNKYFFTEKELEKIKGIKEKFNFTKRNYSNEDCYKSLRENYYKLIRDVIEGNFSINIDERTHKNGKDKYLGGWQHIIIDGCDNFPLGIINIILDKRYTYIGKNVIPEMRSNLEKDANKFNCIKEIIKRAIDRSVIKAKKDITMIAPIYHFTKDSQVEFSFLLPLYLSRNEKPDCVLVFNYIQRKNKYQGVSLLNMKEALQDTRTFASSKQYSWLRE